MKYPLNSENYNQNERKVGLEIEYSGVSLNQASSIVKDLFGGNIERVTSAILKVRDTELGDFTLEIDAMPLKKLAENATKNDKKGKESFIGDISGNISKFANNIGSQIAPFEIISPPILISKLSKMEDLRRALLHAGAKDTKENIYYAFGLHINPEVCSTDPKYITRHIQSFLLLAPKLNQVHNIDLARSVTSFIDPFPKSYMQLIINNEYQPNITELINDYYKYNPTRNRALDMLPLFSYIDEKLIKELYGEKEKINKRPTFHYRLPNCELADENWSINKEWKRWLEVENLASDESLIQDLTEKWNLHQEKWISLDSEWIKEIETRISRLNE